MQPYHHQLNCIAVELFHLHFGQARTFNLRTAFSMESSFQFTVSCQAFKGRPKYDTSNIIKKKHESQINIFLLYHRANPPFKTLLRCQKGKRKAGLGQKYIYSEIHWFYTTQLTQIYNCCTSQNDTKHLLSFSGKFAQPHNK
jgi:hypothetical protein